ALYGGVELARSFGKEIAGTLGRRIACPTRFLLSSSVQRKILGVIPARYASSRFPGKALAQIGSRTMLEHVYERVSMARYLSSVVIATDDERIFDEARRFGAQARMTRSDHLSGTDRVAEVAS